MRARSALFALLLCFGLGMGGGFYWIHILRVEANLPEIRNQRIVNSALQKDLCERLQADLGKFKEAPNTYRRTSLSTIESESRTSLRYLLLAKAVPPNFPIEFHGDDGKYEHCGADLSSWLNIPSIGSQSIEDEYVLAGLSPGPLVAHQPPANPPALRQGRVALVIGNANYRNGPLPNAGNDAHDMAGALRELGFRTDEVRDVNKGDMEAAIAHYVDELKLGEVGFLYFSGHGVEFKGRNYLLPIDFTFNSEDEIPRSGFDLTILLDKLTRARGKVIIVVVDACRSSAIPSRSRGIQQGLGEPPSISGTLVAFSTAPGMVAEDGVGRNSPYTKSLINNLLKPGLRVEDVFRDTAKSVQIETAGRQIPWYSSNLSFPYSLQ